MKMKSGKPSIVSVIALVVAIGLSMASYQIRKKMDQRLEVTHVVQGVEKMFWERAHSSINRVIGFTINNVDFTPQERDVLDQFKDLDSFESWHWTRKVVFLETIKEELSLDYKAYSLDGEPYSLVIWILTAHQTVYEAAQKREISTDSFGQLMRQMAHIIARIDHFTSEDSLEAQIITSLDYCLVKYVDM
jgi:hypothetical protein